LADILVIDGNADKRLEDIKKVNLVIRDGYVVIKEGRIYMERHPDQVIPDFEKEKNDEK
jgi:hypothetical protein